MSVDTIIESCMKDVPKAVAAGVVDLDTGILFGIKTVDSHPQEVVDLLAPATKDLYEGENVVSIENIFKKARGVKGNEHYFNQIIVFSQHLLHYFSRLDSNDRAVMCVVCSADANVGMVLAKAKAIATSETI